MMELITGHCFWLLPSSSKNPERLRRSALQEHPLWTFASGFSAGTFFHQTNGAGTGGAREAPDGRHYISIRQDYDEYLLSQPGLGAPHNHLIPKLK
jgi:hypothetical protein